MQKPKYPRSFGKPKPCGSVIDPLDLDRECGKPGAYTMSGDVWFCKGHWKQFIHALNITSQRVHTGRA